MKLDLLPDFAKPFKTKGFDVRFVRGSYQLFKVSSHRVEGKSYPVLKQEYVGTIDPEKGLIPKKIAPSPETRLVEYGLSHFILQHFRRRIVRSAFNNSCPESLIVMAVIHFIYGHIEERFIRLSYLANKYDPSFIASSPASINRAIRISKNISDYMTELIPDESERDYVIACLRDFKVKSDATGIKINYSDELIDIFRKNEIKYE
jgi:hypothetical protein